jgi:hypothetical protein
MSTQVATEGVLTKTAAYAPINSAAIDISGFTADDTVHIEVTNLTAASGVPVAVFTVEDSVDTFTTAVACGMESFRGPITRAAPVQRSFRVRDNPGIRFGTASARLRINLSAIRGTTPTVTYRAWVDRNA